MERINWADDRKIYQPRIREVRIKDLHTMRELTKRPMTVLVDEALSLYLSTFLCSPEFSAYQEQIERAIDEREEHSVDDYEDLSGYLDNV